MSKINTGGPAFPQPTGVAADGTTFFDGMTLRDYFAGIALKETIKQFYILADEFSEDDDFNPYDCMPPFAKEAYQWADLMLKTGKA